MHKGCGLHEGCGLNSFGFDSIDVVSWFCSQARFLSGFFWGTTPSGCCNFCRSCFGRHFYFEFRQRVVLKRQDENSMTVFWGRFLFFLGSGPPFFGGNPTPRHSSAPTPHTTLCRFDAPNGSLERCRCRWRPAKSRPSSLRRQRAGLGRSVGADSAG